MRFNLCQYRTLLGDNNINVLYSGPLWADGVECMADMLLKRLSFDNIPLSASRSVFSIFIEQINNMMMYSAERELKENTNGGNVTLPLGTFMLGVQDSSYFIQTGNVVTNNSAEILKTRINYLNSLSKQELRQYYVKQMGSTNDNPESKGAGIGLIEIAQRAAGAIEYELEPHSEGFQYFTLYVKVKNSKGEA